MPIQSIVRLYDTADPPVEIGIRLNGCGPDGFIEGYYADIPGNRNNPIWWDKMTQRVQDMIDVHDSVGPAPLTSFKLWCMIPRPKRRA